LKRDEKEQLVQVLHDELGKSQAVFVTDYMGRRRVLSGRKEYPSQKGDGRNACKGY
jgi:hypothetical protein